MPPVPFSPTEPLPYVAEEDDRLLPTPGFVTDFVAALRGIETPSLFCAWSALWALSAASSRLVWMKWLPEAPLFPNLYVFLVAPPGRCHKSTAAAFAMKVLTGVREMFQADSTAEEGFLRFMTDFNWMTSKTTPDVLYELLKPKVEMVMGTDRQISVNKGSQITGCISELATFLNKKKFSTGLVETLTDLFDSKPKDLIHTIGRGTLELKDVYVTLIGATTPTGMKESLPYEVFGEGFISRVVVVYKDKTSRRFSEPVLFAGFPTLESLRERLAWILRHKRGEYDMTADARAWYREWYDGWREGLDKDDRYTERVSEFRFDVNLLRTALLLSMGRYDEAKFIEKQDLIDAHALLKGTFATTIRANVEAGIAINEFNGNYGRVYEYLKKHGSTDRMHLTSAMSAKGIPMATVKESLQQLLTEGRIQCHGPDGVLKDSVAWVKAERYVLAVERSEDNG